VVVVATRRGRHEKVGEDEAEKKRKIVQRL
jgi:hypothetical protein